MSGQKKGLLAQGGIMDYFDIKVLPKKEIREGITVRSVFLNNVMLTYFEFEANTKIPAHRHHHEQITFILEGEMEFSLEGKKRILKAGDGVIVPSNKEHNVSALTRTIVVDAWSPVRNDYVVHR